MLVLLRSRITLIAVALAVAAASLAYIAITSLPASSHGNVTALECNVVGNSGSGAASRGIRFSVTQSFVSVEVRMDADVAGIYGVTAELRRSTGFTEPLLAAYRVSVNLPGTSGIQPYPTVHFEFPPILVLFGATFTLKFTDITGPGTLFFESTGIGNFPCPNVTTTNENNVAVPTERSDPPGFKVLALRAVRWGDVDCSNAAPSAVDALKILREVAGLSVAQTPPCPALGDFVRP